MVIPRLKAHEVTCAVIPVKALSLLFLELSLETMVTQIHPWDRICPKTVSESYHHLLSLADHWTNYCCTGHETNPIEDSGSEETPDSEHGLVPKPHAITPLVWGAW